ncbi:MAG: acyltransferase, partial [Rhizobiaceae bacterium]|nr:acyltransferase [Rhizobiaceae bacterium]
NDLYLLVLNGFFVSDWGFEQGFSFIAPIWSVSIEIFIYIVFFLTLPFLFRWGIVGPVCAAALFAVLAATGVPGVFWPCGFFFFAGSAAFCLTLAGRAPRLAALALALAALIAGSLMPQLAEAKMPALFLAVMLCAASLDLLRAGIVPRRLRWIGDITYSVYLLHVPCQILLMTALAIAGIDHSALARTPWFFLAFLGGVIGLARLSFLYVERPAQAWLRRSFGLRGPAGSNEARIAAP